MNDILGTFFTGFFVGWFLLFYLRRVERKKFTMKGFPIIIAIIFGIIMIKYLHQGTINVWSLYPIGIIIGVVSYIIIAIILGAAPEDIAYGKIIFHEKKKEKGEGEIDKIK